MFEYICPKCHRVLFTGDVKEGYIEVMCKCGNALQITDKGGMVNMRRVCVSYSEYLYLKNRSDFNERK